MKQQSVRSRLMSFAVVSLLATALAPANAQRAARAGRVAVDPDDIGGSSRAPRDRKRACG
jgi:hypothetical protein